MSNQPNALPVPDNFQPLNPTRETEWASFPLSAQTFIWEQQRELAANQHLRELAVQRSVWASRYLDDEQKLSCQQRAHQVVLKDLEDQWDAGTYAGQGFRRLPALVVARIVGYAINGSYHPPSNTREQARLCCVSRLFEAVAIDALEHAYVNSSCRQSVPRRIRALFLSSSLESLDLCMFHDVSSFAYAALVATLPLCTSLVTLDLKLHQPPPDVVEAVARCTSLTTLCCDGCPIELLIAALRRLPKLACMCIDTVHLNSEFLSALPDSSVTHLQFGMVTTAPFSWLDVASRVPKLVVQGRWDESGVDDSDLTGLQDLRLVHAEQLLTSAAFQLRLTRMLTPKLRALVLHETWHDATDLAACLTRLSALTRFTAPTTNIAPILHALPRLPALKWLSVAELSDEDIDSVARLAAGVLPQCKALERLELDGLSRASLVETRLGPALTALHQCTGLRCLGFMALRGVQDDEAVVRCCEALAGHPSLTQLELPDDLTNGCRARCEVLCRPVRLVYGWNYDVYDGIYYA